MIEFNIVDGVLKCGDRICVPDINGLRQRILHEAHYAPYSVHPGTTKMYHDVKGIYWWPGMKKDVAQFVSTCLICQQVKFEHQKPTGLLQELPLPEWKWERITIDFVIGLPRAPKGHDSIWTDGQSERTIQTLEDMLRMCVLDFGGDWERHLPLIEFAYNNSYHSTIRMAPFEALYGRKCRSPLYWTELGERQLEGPDLIQETSAKVPLIQERLRMTFSR
ncbi:hypothetical protein K2173_012230 [Erythroxylum novogranatense]|uniref:Integrase zinc-binding domain-containing protein n=1 Tax=Erythroxylum novogranatense TaxID=1862640 RepID=A0AAV8T935_9ROSI|nr:hypothetical protein K2173_012230 [Erythroxylum novogranatense]